MTGLSVVDAVVIGRNEGARLVACLASLTGQVRRLVYVDSGSTDGSVKAAQAAGKTVQVVSLPVGHHQMTETPDRTLFAIRDFLKR